MDQLVAFGAGHNRPLVGEDGRAVPFELDPAETGDQWFASSVAFDRDLEDRAWSCRWDTTVTELLAGYYERDEHVRRPPESLYGSLKMWAHLNR